jgi:hypothetical protein
MDVELHERRFRPSAENDRTRDSVSCPGSVRPGRLSGATHRGPSNALRRHVSQTVGYLDPRRSFASASAPRANGKQGPTTGGSVRSLSRAIPLKTCWTVVSNLRLGFQRTIAWSPVGYQCSTISSQISLAAGRLHQPKLRSPGTLRHVEHPPSGPEAFTCESLNVDLDCHRRDRLW